MKFSRISFLVLLTFFLNSCNDNTKRITQLDPKLLGTKVGTSENQKFITEIQKELSQKRQQIIPVSVKKQNFKDILVPIITEVYEHLYEQYENVRDNISNNKNREFINSLKRFYNVQSDEELLMALKPHPISIALAQSAIESAWLTSRFTRIANNIFGVWSFRASDARVEANGTRGEKKIYLKKYKNFKSAIFDYYKNLAKNRAYKEFRKQRILTDDPYVLVDYLSSYSEKREKYTRLLKRMIETNQFDKYDIKNEL